MGWGEKKQTKKTNKSSWDGVNKRKTKRKNKTKKEKTKQKNKKQKKMNPFRASSFCCSKSPMHYIPPQHGGSAGWY